MVDRRDMLKRISAYQFALYDLGLFLNSHPDDAAAMRLRCMYKEKLNMLKDAYEQHYGNLVLTQQDVEGSWREWVADPWPWDNHKGGV